MHIKKNSARKDKDQAGFQNRKEKTIYEIF